MAALQEQRHIYYDKDLQIEAYNLSGIVQKFPVHFHEFYVIGFMEGGKRHLWCRDREYDTQCGDVILFNPRETHNCAPVAGEVLDYRAINVPVDVMDKAVQEITGRNIHLQFKDTLIPQAELALSIRELYDVIVTGSSLMVREEAFYFLIEQLLEEHMIPVEPSRELTEAVKRMKQFLDTHFEEPVSLDTLSEISSMSRYQLLRMFTREVGVSPYRYLQSIRIAEAKLLLEQGEAIGRVALDCGFSDQSHFTNYFKSFIGITPKQYQSIFTQKRSNPDE